MDAQEKALRQALGTDNVGTATGQEYSQEQLKGMAEGVFKDQPNEPAFFVDKYGTFKNQLQYDNLSAEDQKTFTKLENPSLGTSSAPASGASSAELEAAKATIIELQAEIERLNGLKSVAAAKAIQADLDAANAKIAELTKPQ